MKQILIFTRIAARGRENEFSNLFDGRDKPIETNFDDINLVIFDGFDVYADKNKEIAQKIKDKINDETDEVLIVVHFTGNFEGLSGALNKLKGNSNWVICGYSGTDDNYQGDNGIRELLQKVATDNTKIEEIYRLFSLDPIKEEKLKLIERIKNGEAQKGDKLDEKIKHFQSYFDEFIENNHDYFSVVENQNALDEYRIAYNKFYEKLELEN